jgi:hypothetical protein
MGGLPMYWKSWETKDGMPMAEINPNAIICGW